MSRTLCRPHDLSHRAPRRSTADTDRSHRIACSIRGGALHWRATTTETRGSTRCRSPESSSHLPWPPACPVALRMTPSGRLRVPLAARLSPMPLAAMSSSVPLRARPQARFATTWTFATDPDALERVAFYQTQRHRNSPSFLGEFCFRLNATRPTRSDPRPTRSDMPPAASAPVACCMSARPPRGGLNSSEGSRCSRKS